MSSSNKQCKNCIFCKIVNKTEEKEILYEDDDYIAFHDIRPAAKQHYLIIPKQHIKSANTLKSADITLVEKLVSIGKEILMDKAGKLDDSRMGFHWPPFHAISHLHLHVISPKSDLGFLGKIIFRENSYWFVSPESTIEFLKSKI